MNNQSNESTYQPDDGPLTEEQIACIKKLSSATDTPEERFTERLF